ncbi:hypothetical protein [Actinomadura chibensis]|uniref:DUF4190 domain-containing protein n=1 Tax=Actinomadura chibensis TaxID=392828 RepID=A0A5D0NNJ0_9ACTN|nr:hypothetical protein [Actinomadura chibensis]TYB46103.1 hypothetical protein FXF69_12405 [Actinomadura chibensis]
MSGYGGGPYGGSDPYGGSQGWGGYGGSYGAGPYGQPPGYGPGAPPRSGSNGGTIAALVCNIAAVLLCCGLLSIPGAVTAAIALSRADTDPESARKLTVWSWVLLGLSIVAGIVIFIVYIVAVVASTPSYESPDGL